MPLDPSLAQSNIRSTFPGRRVGGATRGDCTARLIIHLVPPSSVYAPGPEGLVALLQGPAQQPRPLEVVVKPYAQPGVSAPTPQVFHRQELPAASAGVTVLRLPLRGQLEWSSSFACGHPVDPAQSIDPLSEEAMVTEDGPPARSLLVMDATPADLEFQARIRSLLAMCGKTIARDQLVGWFLVQDGINDQWPSQLPVRCPS